MQSAAINTHAESLYYAAQLIDGWTSRPGSLSECYLNKQALFPHPAEKKFSVSFTQVNLASETQNFVY